MNRIFFLELVIKTAKMKLPPHELTFIKATAPYVCNISLIF